MIPLPLGTRNIFKNIFKEEGGREINIYSFKNYTIVGGKYLNTFLKKEEDVWNPVEEKVMSLKDAESTLNIDSSVVEKHKKVEDCPVFFFIYNDHNYYHFLYDTIPYLISYKKLKEKIPELKLLVSVEDKFGFFYDTLKILSIKTTDIIKVEKNTLYKQIFVSNSYTHGIDSNLPPRKEIYKLFNDMSSGLSNTSSCKKIYISRRTWINKDLSNIGTNYTDRRKMANEDDLVKILETYGYKEIFTESLSMLDKIEVFKNSKNIVAPIGGGVVNVLFCKPHTKINLIVSPGFLDINKRFRFLFKNIDVNYIFDTQHVEKQKYKKFMRVQYNNIVGEIFDTNSTYSTIRYSEDIVSGWIKGEKYKEIKVKNSDLKILDNGLNSRWLVDLEKITQRLI